MSAPTFPRVVLFNGGALLALWAASFALSYASLGSWALTVALAIAVVKAALVVLVFMELLRESLSIKLTLLAAVALLLTLIGLMVADIATRSAPPRALGSGSSRASRPIHWERTLRHVVPSPAVALVRRSGRGRRSSVIRVCRGGNEPAPASVQSRVA